METSFLGPFHIGNFYFDVHFRQCLSQENFQHEQSTFELNDFRNFVLQYRTWYFVKEISGNFA